MPKDSKTPSDSARDAMHMPDLVELWKMIYFSSEETWSRSARDFVASDTFIGMLQEIKDRYLSAHKLSTAYMDKYFETNPVPSKKDIARVAELVIALEDKIDRLDLQFVNNLDSIARSFMKMVDIQQGLHQTVLQLQQEVQLLRQSSHAVSTDQAGDSGPDPIRVPKKTRTKKVQPSDTD